LRADAAGETEHALYPGDCFILATNRPYAVASAPGLEPVDGLPLYRASATGSVRVGNGDGDEVAMTGGRFELDAGSARLLLDVLPPLLVVGAQEPRAATLRAALTLFDAETAEPGLGSFIVTDGLGRVVFVEALRAAIGSEDGRLRGWLAALADERVGRALHAIHEDPARHFTVPELAAMVHMSRSSFAARFRTLVGTSPLHHALRVRMHVAARSLRTGNATVSEIGAAAGYTSDAAFSNAFKRVLGVAPSAWRTTSGTTLATLDETDAGPPRPRTRPPATQASRAAVASAASNAATAGGSGGSP
jgi:AraC-like DNA-binding protein